MRNRIRFRQDPILTSMLARGLIARGQNGVLTLTAKGKAVADRVAKEKAARTTTRRRK